MARKPEPVKRPSKITVPEKANPLARLVFAEMNRQGVTYAEMEWRSGVLLSTLKAWRSDNAPGLLTIEACLGALGWSLVPVPAADRVPPDIAAELDKLRERWAGEEPLLHRLLASACLAPVMVDRIEPAAANPTGHKSTRKAPPRRPATIDVTPTRVTTTARKRDPNPHQVSLFQ